MSRSDFVAGFRAAIPFVPGYIPLGIIVGVTAREFGMSVVEATGMSAVTFTGGAQLAAMELTVQGSPFGVIVLTALLLNLRLSIFSAGVEPYLRSFSRSWKWLSGFFLSTPAYILSAAELEPGGPPSGRWYYFGVAIPIYVNWVLSTMVGAVLGGRVPEGLQLDFALPLVFIVLLREVVDDRRTLLAAAVGGIVAVGAANVPFNLGIIVATVIGTSAGFIADWRGERRTDA